MKVLRGDRWSALSEMIDAPPASLLDVGCRDRELLRHLPPTTHYLGFDLFPPADVIGSAEEPLPFAGDEFDVVVLADVLEHLDNPHSALDEAMRVASTAVVVFLPNLYSLLHRVRYVQGVTADKYEFGPDRKLDRHRWVMNVDQAAAFTRGRADLAGWRVADERGWNGGYARPSARLGYGAARWLGSPNLWAWGYAARLEPCPLRESSGA